MSLDLVTLAERFRGAGWSTWAFVANPNVYGEGLRFEQGFDRFVGLRGPNDTQTRTEALNQLAFYNSFCLSISDNKALPALIETRKKHAIKPRGKSRSLKFIRFSMQAGHGQIGTQARIFGNQRSLSAGDHFLNLHMFASIELGLNFFPGTTNQCFVHGSP